MQYVYSLPAAAAFKGKGLTGYTFGPLVQKNLECYYVEVDGGHDTFMISKKIVRTYYILSGSGSFTIDNRGYDVGPGMLVEVPPKVEFTYSGKMTFVVFSRPGWSFGNDRHTRWNAAVFGADFAAPLPNGNWRSRVLWWRTLGVSPVAAGLAVNQAVWNLLPTVITAAEPVRRYGEFLHKLARAQSKRGQAFSPVLMRNRPELELLRRLAERRNGDAPLRVAVLGCGAGADVYSVAWTLRSARPDLQFVLQAADVSREAVKFGRAGRYPLQGSLHVGQRMFARLTRAEMASMFDWDGDEAIVKPWLREGISWHVRDLSRADLVDALGQQDIVTVGDFLCHMDDAAAEACLRNIGRVVAPQGNLIASGVDPEVRRKVAEALGWTPVPELLEEIHDGDERRRRLWPCHYAALEPLDKGRGDWLRRYAAAFQLGDSSDAQGRALEAVEAGPPPSNDRNLCAGALAADGPRMAIVGA